MLRAKSDVWESRDIIYLFWTLALVSGKLNAQVTLSPGKEPQVLAE